jgi:cysteine desulfurase/selenocysteine lyase
MNSLIEKSQFIGLDNSTWLYSGAETPPHKSSLEQVTQYFQMRGKGPEGRDYNSNIENACKKNIAKLLNGLPEQIALMSSTSEAISSIAQGMDLREGDNVIINTLEFPSGVLPWLLLKEKGVEVRVVSHHTWQISVDDILSKMDERTKLVVTSHVSYLTGARLDYKLLYQKVKTTNALLLLDATQSLGVCSVDMNEADLVVCSTYKWLLSIHGGGILAINPKRTQHIIPQAVGWRSVRDMFSDNRFESFTFYEDARRFELGYPNYAMIYSLHYTTGLLLQVGIDRIENHILALGSILIAQLKAKGYEVMTPENSNHRAGNICVVCPDGEKVADYLREKKVYLWGGDGRIRASLHMFNDSTDVDRLMELMQSHNEMTKERLL